MLPGHQGKEHLAQRGDQRRNPQAGVPRVQEGQTAEGPGGWSTVTKERGLDHVGPLRPLNRLWSHGRLHQRSDMLQIRLEEAYDGESVAICANGGHRYGS